MSYDPAPEKCHEIEFTYSGRRQEAVEVQSPRYIPMKYVYKIHSGNTQTCAQRQSKAMLLLLLLQLLPSTNLFYLGIFEFLNECFWTVSFPVQVCPSDQGMDRGLLFDSPHMWRDQKLGEW